MSRAKWKSIALGFGTLSLILIVYILTDSFNKKNSKDNERGYLAIYVENEDILPVHVYLGDKKLGVVRTTIPSSKNCESAHVGIELVAEKNYELIMYGKKWKYKKQVHITADKCKKIIAR